MLDGGRAAAQIPRDQYLKYLSLTYPRLVRETVATRQWRLYGDPADPAFRDVEPRDGVDDARARWLEGLGGTRPEADRRVAPVDDRFARGRRIDAHDVEENFGRPRWEWPA